MKAKEIMDEQSKARRILRAPAVCERTGKGRVSLWRGVRAGTFPAPVKLGSNSVGWYEDEVDRWIAERPRAYDNGTAQVGHGAVAKARRKSGTAPVTAAKGAAHE